MRSSRERLSRSSVFLSGAFLAVWAAGAVAREPLEGGTWSFSGIIRSKSCGTSTSFRGGRRIVTTGCFPDGGGGREKRSLDVPPGKLPTPGVLAPGTGCNLRGLVHYVASRTHPRRFVLVVDDRAAVIREFASCSVPPEEHLIGYRLNRWSSIITVSADGQHVRQRDVLWDTLLFDGPHGRVPLRATFAVRGRRTGDVAPTAAVGQDSSDPAD